MKTYTLGLAGLLLFVTASVQAEKLKLNEKQIPAPTWPGYSENLNLTPAFHILQNDPDLPEYFTSKNSEVTNLCVPASATNLFLYQIAKRPTLLKLKSLSFPEDQDGFIDGANAVRSVIDYCRLNPRGTNLSEGVDWFDMGSCMARLYQESGYSNTDITYIRKNQGYTNKINYQNRYPTLSDIRDTLKNGGEVIAVISSLSGTHAINFFGYSANDNDPDHLVVYVQNSNRKYKMNFTYPVFDVAMLTETHAPSVLGSKFSSIELTTLAGRLLNFPDQRTYLAALLLVQVKEPVQEPAK